jgi:hypothetical protein
MPLVVLFAILNVTFTSCGDTDIETSRPAVWIDPATGLMWQNGPDVGSAHQDWTEARDYCRNLFWGGVIGWRLPTVSELRSLIRGSEGTAIGGACGVTDECLSYHDCWSRACFGENEFEGPSPSGAFWPSIMDGLAYWSYWSSSPVVDCEGSAWAVNFGNGAVNGAWQVGLPLDLSPATFATRCVR